VFLSPLAYTHTAIFIDHRRNTNKAHGAFLLYER
jgi:hypothetical protein